MTSAHWYVNHFLFSRLSRPLTTRSMNHATTKPLMHWMRTPGLPSSTPPTRISRPVFNSFDQVPQTASRRRLLNPLMCTRKLIRLPVPPGLNGEVPRSSSLPRAPLHLQEPARTGPGDCPTSTPRLSHRIPMRDVENRSVARPRLSDSQAPSKSTRCVKLTPRPLEVVPPLVVALHLLPRHLTSMDSLPMPLRKLKYLLKFVSGESTLIGLLRPRQHLARRLAMATV